MTSNNDNKRHTSILIIRCPHCQLLQLDSFSLGTLNVSFGIDVGCSQPCKRCNMTIDVPDHIRLSKGKLAVIPGQNIADAFVVDLITSISNAVSKDGEFDATKIIYKNRPSILQQINRLAHRSPKANLITAASVLAIINWTKPFLQTQLEHHLALKEADHNASISQQLLEYEYNQKKEVEILKHKLELERSRQQADLTRATQEEADFLKWLASVPEIKNPDDSSFEGVLRNLQELLNRLNSISDRLMSLENARKQSILDSCGKAHRIDHHPRNNEI